MRRTYTQFFAEGAERHAIGLNRVRGHQRQCKPDKEIEAGDHRRRVANDVSAGTYAWVRAILGTRVRLSRSPPFLELELSPAEASRVTPTSEGMLNDQGGSR